MMASSPSTSFYIQQEKLAKEAKFQQPVDELRRQLNIIINEPHHKDWQKKKACFRIYITLPTSVSTSQR